ncbi:hypothetical protein [Variovorax sp. OV329]|uniref:hypothetical protein n=1 Tax=Variovorax sp. OV329 TaxID=1882825 RepID=UPI0008E9C3FD|nr:hypothetical protein [Variovorax sp. OV329]SFL87651.1 hypothetical protein SAMN05444747_10187 [Variovorax sp. OV329]
MALGALVLVLTGWRVFFASAGLPIQVGDALFFIPTAVQHMLLGDLSNPYMSPIQQSGGPYVWHGWLYPMALSALGSLVGGQDVRAILVLDSLLVVLAALLFAWKVSMVRAPAWLKAATVACACAMLTSNAGRPEVIAQLLLVLWLLSVKWPLDRGSDIVTALILALIAVAQPTIALLGGVFFSIYRSHASSTGHAIWSIAWVALSSAILALLLTALIYPWSMRELAMGILEQGRSLSRRDDGDFALMYLKLAASPLQLAWIVLAVLLGAVLVMRGVLQKPASAVLFYPLLLLALYLCWRFGMRISYTAYNVAVFFPLVAYALLLASVDQRLMPFTVLFKLALVGMALVLLLAQLRTFAVFKGSAADAAVISRLEQDVEADLRAGSRVALSPNLALTNYGWAQRRNVTVLPLIDIGRAGQADVVYLNQASTGARTPAEYPGWRVAGNHFVDGVQFLGRTVANTPVSYAYARYVRAAARPAKAPAGAP